MKARLNSFVLVRVHESLDERATRIPGLQGLAIIPRRMTGVASRDSLQRRAAAAGARSARPPGGGLASAGRTLGAGQLLDRLDTLQTTIFLPYPARKRAEI